MKLADFALQTLIPALVLVHLIAAPHTKVEESFNIQATHNVLVYGTPIADVYTKLSSYYDHFAFRGAVPRTFVGAVLLAGLSQPIIAFVGFQHAQVVVRAVLGLLNAATMVVVARNLRSAHGATAARWYLALQASQFHVVFYASRTLPNMFAFGLTTLSFAWLIPQPHNPKSAVPRQRLAIAYLVCAAAVFRAEVAVLLGATALYLVLIPPRTPLRVIVPPLVVSFVVVLAISVPMDSYFWQTPVWPELWGFYFNVIHGSSSLWGVSPWHFYFTSALPRLLLNPLIPILLLPLALRHPATAVASRRLVVPSLAYIAIYSIQPHKEARFIIYVVPPITAAAALGADILVRRRAKSQAATLAVYGLAASVLASLATSTAMLLVSSLNYPGGEALAHLRHIVRTTSNGIGLSVVHIHADVLACMTGVTLFGTATGPDIPNVFRTRSSPAVVAGSSATAGAGTLAPAPALIVDKTEHDPALLDKAFWTRFDYVLAENPATVKGGMWDTIAVAHAYSGIEVLSPSQSPAGVGTEGRAVGKAAALARWRTRLRRLSRGWWVGPRMLPKIYIMERRKERSGLHVVANA